MKTLFSIALAVSLGANLVLLYFITRPSPSDDVVQTSLSSTATAVTPGTSTGLPGIDPRTWSNLETSDLPTLMDRLRAKGFPPEIVRAIVAAEVSNLFQARRRALEGNPADRAYWKNVALDPNRRAEQARLRREETQMLRELLGDDYDANDMFARARSARELGHLSPAKASEVSSIIRDFDQRRSEALGGGSISMIEREKMVALDRERRDAIRAVLSPEEFLEYELRGSNTAHMLRNDLAAFEPTEEEFRKIFGLRQPFDEEFNPMLMGPGMAQDVMRRRRDAEQQLQAQIKEVLSPERAAEYDRKTDYSYRQTSQLVSRLGLPAETTDQLFAAQKEFEQRRNEIFRATANREEAFQHINTLQAEALQKITPILQTPSALEAYQRYGGRWLQPMTPPRRPGG